MEYQAYIECKKETYKKFYDTFQEENENNESYEILINNIEEQKIQEDKEELKLFLQLILNVSNNHHRNPSFIQKIFQIIDYLSIKIKQNFANFDIFNIMKDNQIILIYSIKNHIITIDEQISKEILHISTGNKWNYKYLFYPEIKSFISAEEGKDIESNMKELDSKIFELFEEKRNKGENDANISELIRKDSITDFVVYVNKTNLPLSSQIRQSIFESNSLLKEKSSTLIEYASFYGSIQIIKYLSFNGIKLTPSLWIYSIHSNNAELIQFLVENKVDPPNMNYHECLFESIQCHHNEISDYIREQLLDTINDKNISTQEREMYKIVGSSNFKEMPSEIDNKYIFFYLCNYGYSKLVDLYIRPKQEKIKKEIIQ